MSEHAEARGGNHGARSGVSSTGAHYEGSIEDIDRQLEALDQESDSDSESLEELEACENIEVVNRASGSADGYDDQSGPALDVTVRYTICLFCKKPFQLKKELKKHLFEHMKNLKPMKEKKIVEKKFKCHKCFKTYTEMSRAEKHMTKCKKVSKLLLDMSNTTPDGNRILSGGADYEGGGGGDKKKSGKFREPTSPRSLVFDPESDQDERWEHRERNTVVHFDERTMARGGSTDESPTSPPAVSGGGGGGSSYFQQYQRCK
ncbi:uncharacterized protein LOC131677763 isoform X2 [Topomyia yanbarensis]|uniref:uncharacterized protein LOC131677763 isoform X2 n=1 Tax=Topomyia yanbarensis TaxID=2498891 RepID=UPI00273AC505|nr:uncharacterized protein LOC131677763 isoform X2 [Topomyia yanbarensis]